MGKGHVQTDYQLKSNSYTFYTGLTLDADLPCTPGPVDTQCAPVGAEGGIHAKKEGKVDRT